MTVTGNPQDVSGFFQDPNLWCKESILVYDFPTEWMPLVENQTQCWQLLSYISNWLPPKKCLAICQEDVRSSTATLEVFFFWIHAWTSLYQQEKWPSQVTAHSEWILLRKKNNFIFNVQKVWIMIIDGKNNASWVLFLCFTSFSVSEVVHVLGNNLISKVHVP